VEHGKVHDQYIKVKLEKMSKIISFMQIQREFQKNS
jgi:hypothetical protein